MIHGEQFELVSGRAHNVECLLPTLELLRFLGLALELWVYVNLMLAHAPSIGSSGNHRNHTDPTQCPNCFYIVGRAVWQMADFKKL